MTLDASAELSSSEAEIPDLPPMPQVLALGRRAPFRTDAIGRSAAWQRALDLALQVAPTEATALLHGASGTGKEVLARLIHRSSPRKNGPFVALNCAALPETLLESELFGYERGAFSGAHQSKPGQLELASGGVLFLDEVSEMSPLAQAKFLRVLQEREYMRVGGTRLLKANIRVIAATNRDLPDAVARGTFRQDLYYRLQVFDIQLPALRERVSDIPLLTDALLEQLGREIGRPARGVASEVRELLARHDWPGNVRELRNALERALILCGGGMITREHIALRPAPAPTSLSSDLNVLERARIERALCEADWNIAKSARRLGLTRTQLYVRLRKYQLQRPSP